MEQNELNEIIEKHKKWLNDEEGGEYADMSYADLSGADLRGADLSCANMCHADLSGANMRHAKLSGANMRYANLSGADTDYSAWPLWCGSIKAHVDDRIAIQLLYHTLSVVQHSPYVSDEVKRALLTDTVVDIANRFHHADECGKLAVYQTEDT